MSQENAKMDLPALQQQTAKKYTENVRCQDDKYIEDSSHL
jgi:hypothetical protein